MSDKTAVYKTIWVKNKTHDELTSIGTKSQSYDDIINMLITAYKKRNEK
jgi:predicted CopG family antitoxin